MAKVHSIFSLKRTGTTSIALVLIFLTFAIATVFFARPQTSSFNPSSVTGLMSLKQMSREAISYDVALSHKKPILIEFYADWCTTCQSLAPTLLALHDEFSAEIDFVTIDIDDPQWSQPIEQFHVTGVPQLTLLQVDRSIADTFIGKVPKSILMDRLQVLVSSSVSSN